MKKTKSPFAPISLTGKQAIWFVDYLEGKVFSKAAESKRKKVIEEAEKVKSSDAICLN